MRCQFASRSRINVTTIRECIEILIVSQICYWTSPSPAVRDSIVKLTHARCFAYLDHHLSDCFDLFDACAVVQAAFYMAFQLCRDLTAQSVNGGVEKRRPFNILRYQPCHENKACLTSSQNVCVTQYVSVHQPSRYAQIFCSTSVHLGHHTLGDLSV